MELNTDLPGLRARVAELVAEEAALLQEALAVSRKGGDRKQVDALMNKVPALQAERTRVKRRIEQLLGDKRMCSADEVFKPGIYEYYRQVGGASVRVEVRQGATGLQLALPGESKPVGLHAVPGFFEGPLPAARAEDSPSH